MTDTQLISLSLIQRIRDSWTGTYPVLMQNSRIEQQREHQL
jgi:hypothetical protein